MEECPRRGESHRARVDRFANDAAHLLQIRFGGGLAIRAARAHDVDADRRMRHVSADVHVVRARGEKVEILGIGFPCPGQSIGQHGMRNVLDAFHQPDEQVMLIVAAWREADAAIAHDDGRDAVRR